MDNPLKVLVVAQDTPATEWLLNHAATFEYIETDQPDVVVVQLTSEAMNDFVTQLHQREQARLSIGDLMIDLNARRITLADTLIHLTPTEFRLLRMLACRVGAVVSHEELMTALTNSTHPEHLLHVHMSNLRRKIECDPDKPRYILSVSSIGYRLVKS